MYNEYNMGTPNYMPRRGINWNSILNNTQRTLGIINQAIPIIYQVKPLLNNARTLFRVASALNSNYDDEVNEVREETNYNSNVNYETKKDSNGPIFYL